MPWLLGAYLAVMSVITVSGIGHLGYYFDELIHMEKLQTFLDHGLYVVSVGYDSHGQLVSTFGKTYVYGPFFSLIAHAVACLVGIEHWGTVGYTDASFAVRHYVVAAMSLVTTFAAGWGVKLVTRSVTWGLAGAALLVSIPMWSGAALFDLKDVPFSMGYTLLTVGCIAMMRDRTALSRASLIGSWVAVFVGTTATWGMRPGMWVAVVLHGVAMLLIHAKLTNFASWRTSLRSLVFPASAVVASYFLMVAVYPRVYGNPITWLGKSLFASSGFSHDDIVLTDGEQLHMPPPWYYIPKWLGAQLPELVVVFMVLAVVTSIALVVWRITKSTPQAIDSSIPGIAFPFIQFAAFPIAAVLVHAQITSGLRQFLFIIPALMMLITVMLFEAKRAIDSRAIRFAWPTVVTLIAASTLATSVIQAQLVPYQFNYFNPTTMAKGVTGNWEIYAVKLSSGELYAGLSQAERERCAVRCPALSTFPESFRASTAADENRLQYWQIIHYPKTRDAIDGKEGCSGVASRVDRPYLLGRFTIAVTDMCALNTKTLGAMRSGAASPVKWWEAVSQWGWGETTSAGLTSSPGQPSAIAWRRTAEQLTVPTANTVKITVNAGSATDVRLITTINGVDSTPRPIGVGQTISVPVGAPPVTDPNAPKDIVVVQFTLTDASGKPVTNTLSVTALD